MGKGWAGGEKGGGDTMALEEALAAIGTPAFGRRHINGPPGGWEERLGGVRWGGARRENGSVPQAPLLGWEGRG